MLARRMGRWPLVAVERPPLTTILSAVAIVILAVVMLALGLMRLNKTRRLKVWRGWEKLETEEQGRGLAGAYRPHPDPNVVG